MFVFGFDFVVEVVDWMGVDRAGGKIGEEFDGDDGVEVGEVGRVWGENVIDCGFGGSNVVEVVIWTISVSIYYQLISSRLPFLRHFLLDLLIST